MHDSNQFSPLPEEYNNRVSRKRGFAPSPKLTETIGKSVFSRLLPKNNIWSLALWIWVVPLALGRLQPLWENDFYLHIRMGNDILAHHRLTGDPAWVYGSGHTPWRTTMAISEVLMALAYRIGGNTIFSLMMLAATLLIPFILWKTLRLLLPQRNSKSILAILAITSIATGTWMTTLFLPRPQTISLLLFPCLIVWVIQFAHYGRLPSRKLLIPFTIFWVCFHGYGLLVAPLLLAAGVAHLLAPLALQGGNRRRLLTLAYQRIKSNALTLALVLLATLVNPLGFGIYTASLKIRTGSHGFILEWLMPSSHSDVYVIFLILLSTWLLASIRFISTHNFSASAKVIVIREGVLLLIAILAFVESVRTFDLLLLLTIYIAVNRVIRTFFSSSASAIRASLKKRKASDLKNQKLGSIIKLAVVITIILSWTSALSNGNNLSTMGRDYIPTKLYLDINSVPGHHNVLIAYNISSTVLVYIPDASTSLDGRVDENGISGSKDYTDMLLGKSKWKQVLSRYPGTTDAILVKKDKITKLLLASGWVLRDSQKTVADNTVYAWLTPPVKQ